MGWHNELGLPQTVYLEQSVAEFIDGFHSYEISDEGLAQEYLDYADWNERLEEYLENA